VPLTRLAPAAWWLALAGAGLALLSVAAVRLGGIQQANGLVLLGAGGAASVLAALCAVAALSRIWRFGGTGTARAVKALILGAAVLAPLTYQGIVAIRWPALNAVVRPLARRDGCAVRARTCGIRRSGRRGATGGVPRNPADHP
jgi:hypothetical protein